MYGRKRKYMVLTVGAEICGWFMMLYNEKEAKDMEPDFVQFACIHS
jgi:hypothetical protein